MRLAAQHQGSGIADCARLVVAVEAEPQAAQAKQRPDQEFKRCSRAMPMVRPLDQEMGQSDKNAERRKKDADLRAI
jgi:hypothetical protein